MAYDDWGWRPYVSAARAAAQSRARNGKAQEAGSRRLAGESSKAAPSRRRSGAKLGARTWNATAISPTGCRAGGPMCATVRWSICRSMPARSTALVSGSEIYKVKLKVTPVAKARWKSICNDCAGAIDSLVELLQGRLSKGVMERICRQNQGLFPSPARSSFPAVVRIGPACASTSRRCCTASARVSIISRNCSSGCTKLTRRTSSPKPARACRWPRQSRRPVGFWVAIFPISLAWIWAKSNQYVYGHLSVRNGEAGSPAALYRLQPSG